MLKFVRRVVDELVPLVVDELVPSAMDELVTLVGERFTDK